MAGAGYKLFAAGDVLSASDVNTYMMQQTVMVFANSTARTTALSSVLAEGMVSYLQDTNSLEVYDGSAWVGATGDITGLTAGTGVSITSATGPVPTVAIDTAVVPQLGAANTFTTSPQQIDAGASSVGLIVRLNATGTSDLQQWQSSAGVTVASVRYFGSIHAGTSIGSTQMSSVATNASTIGLIVRGAASQTANLQQWQNSAGTVVARIDTAGQLFINSSAGSWATGPGLGVITTSAAALGIAVRGAASQTANLQEWQNSAGTAGTYITSLGRIFTNQRFAINDTNFTGFFTVFGASASTVQAIIRGAASQSVNLTEWQDSGGTVLASVSLGGGIRGANSGTLNTYVLISEANSGGQIRMTKQTAATTNPGSGIGALYFRDGTNAGTLKLVVRAGASGAETTILDNIPQ